MGREIDNAVVLKNDADKGQIQIADDVVAMIASLAATEVEGVAGMAVNIMSKVGVKKLTKGVKVEMTDNNVKVLLSVTMQYGYNIPSVCAKVQDKVKTAIENMTGLNCTDVSIRIIGVK